MSISDISLTSGMRSNLVNLQSTVDLINRTQTRLTTGKKVNSALDDPTNYFTSRDHLNRASDLASRKDGMGEAIQNVKAATAGIEGITKLLDAAKGLTQSARSANTASRATLAAQFDTLLTQIDELASDSGYKGINLLASNNLTVDFNENGNNQLTINGFDASSSGLGLSAVSSGSTTVTTITTAVVEGYDPLDNAVMLPAGTVTTAVEVDINDNPQNYRIVDSATGGSGGIATGTNPMSGWIPCAGEDYWANLVSGSFSAGEAVTVQYDPNGFNQTTGLPNIPSTGGNAWVTNGDIDASVTQLDNAMTTLRSHSSSLSSNLSVVTIRQDFTNSMVNTLETGADKLTLADMNEEGANMLMLQTRQSLGTTALSLASQAAQSVLRLF
jgi:flagellin